MKLAPLARPALLPAAALALAGLLLAPTDTRAFSTLGWALGFDQRDVRVYDNFADPQANDNQVADPNWPGFTGVELAVWKAAAEWGSSLHGDGSGDPSQPGDLGSGAAAFDPTWQGNAPDPGGATDNVVSATTMGAGGVLATTEFGPGGWRIRLNDQFVWDDGPGNPLPGANDVQGILTHEYGHALGLGHSVVAGATMSTGVGQVAARSIEPDDVAGLQFVYGTASALKPYIGAVSGGTAAGPVVIDGFAFSPAGNEVWFTQAGVNPTGAPIKVTGASATLNGTRIELAFPVGAGPGDVLVLNGFGRLSNAFPFDAVGCELPVSYCTAGTTASGCTAQMAWTGSPSASNPADFLVLATGAEGQKGGLFYFGTSGRQASPWGNGTSLQCVVPPVARTPLQTSSGNPGQCDGTFLYDLNTHWSVLKPQTNPGPGATVQVQTWFRDPGNTSSQTTSLSDALELTVCP